MNAIYCSLEYCTISKQLIVTDFQISETTLQGKGVRETGNLLETVPTYVQM